MSSITCSQTHIKQSHARNLALSLILHSHHMLTWYKVCMSCLTLTRVHLPLAITLKEMDISSHAPYVVYSHAPIDLEERVEEEIEMKRNTITEMMKMRMIL